MKKSPLEESFLKAWKAYASDYPQPIQQYKFHPTRKYRADFAFLQEKILIEVQGGAYGKGRHHTATGYSADCLRQIHAVIEGWTMIYLDTLLMKNPKRCVELVKEILDTRKGIGG